LQVLIQHACNNLVSKLGLEKETKRSWSEFLKRLSEDQWSQVELGGGAQEILMEASNWLDISLVTTTMDMAKAIHYLQKLRDGDDHDDQDLIQGTLATCGDRLAEWDKAFRLESVEDVLGWDELFKLASGSDKSFTEFLNLGPSSSPAALVLPVLNRRSRSSHRPS
jgi:hypothetical protein